MFYASCFLSAGCRCVFVAQCLACPLCLLYPERRSASSHLSVPLSLCLLSYSYSYFFVCFSSVLSAFQRLPLCMSLPHSSLCVSTPFFSVCFCTLCASPCFSHSLAHHQALLRSTRLSACSCLSPRYPSWLYETRGWNNHNRICLRCECRQKREEEQRRFPEKL